MIYVPDRRLHLPPPTKIELATIPMLGALVEIGAWDRNGRLFHQKREPSRSPVKQFLQWLCLHIQGVTITITETDGTTTAVAPGTGVMDGMAALDDDTHGIVIGTGSTAVDITDSKLATQILQGSTSLKMVYNADGGDIDVTVADPNCTFAKWRNFNNNSGASITVAETGIYVRISSYVINLCIVRDIPTAVAVPDGGGCYVKYTLKITE